MEEPGRLRDLGKPGRAAWDEAVAWALLSAMPSPAAHRYLVPASDEETPHTTGPDWSGLPARAVATKGRSRALAALDSRRRDQEEYVEWRVVRDGRDRIRRVELTTELRDYWRVLAAHEPARTLALAAELARRRVRPQEVYGLRDPLAAGPDERADGFDTTMPAAPLNDGRDAICFMSHPSNDLVSLVRIAAAATRPLVVRDADTGELRPATADEAIPHLGDSAVAGRTSDPVIVERLGRLAYEGRRVALNDPVGVYIEGVEHTRLRTPHGSPVPADWFTASRGGQRLVLEVPASKRFAVSDLVDVATEEPVSHGGQIAELVQLRVLLRVSDPGAVTARPERVPAG